MSLNHLKNVNDQLAPYLNIGCNDLKVNGTAIFENIAVDSLNVGALTVTGVSNLNGDVITANNVSATGEVNSGAVITGGIIATGLQLNGNANINGSLRIFNHNPFQYYYPMSYAQALISADYLAPRGSFYYGGTNNQLPITRILMVFNNALDCTALVNVVNQTGQAPPFTPTGSTTICQQSTGFAFNQYSSIDLGTISNLPAGPAILTVNCYRTSGTQLTQLYGIMVYYGNI